MAGDTLETPIFDALQLDLDLLETQDLLRGRAGLVELALSLALRMDTEPTAQFAARLLDTLTALGIGATIVQEQKAEPSQTDLFLDKLEKLSNA